MSMVIDRARAKVVVIGGMLLWRRLARESVMECTKTFFLQRHAEVAAARIKGGVSAVAMHLIFRQQVGERRSNGSWKLSLILSLSPTLRLLLLLPSNR